MLLTVTTTHRPAGDLGYLLVKHPDRVHEFSLPSGTAYVFYPEVGADRCTAALLLDIDLGARSRQRAVDPSLGRYLNDRPYAASSLLSAALARAYRSALRGQSKDRPELAATPIPLELGIPALRCHGGADLAQRLFAPLGWAVAATPVPLDTAHPDWGLSQYVSLSLRGTLRLADALNHVYVLLPVLDDAKHYWVAPDEIDKLLRAGEGWLAGHPERRLIITRYLAHRRALARAADSALGEPEAPEEGELPAPATERVSLARQRAEAVLAALAECGAARVLDLGCGPGALLAALVKERRYTEIVGVDVSPRALELAHRRLRLDRAGERQAGRVRLLQSALTYRDQRLAGYDAAVLMEVVEHVDPPRLPDLARAVFGHARPGAVVVTTPNAEYNIRYPSLTGLRHHDHRFEWTRPQFAAWADGVATGFGYAVELRPVGEHDPEVGTPTQLALFTLPRGGTT
ncbi:MAG TPA: 3' terminal RNA ribose 2'-O-methyltransferase Hen1 [Rugosimonospora sp.]|nr:3' terminal RNA ribose 2'-O-methyltransferase Hen1 [Rugosimonospora sp.]